MPRKNRYTSVLRPQQVGPPRGEQPLVLLYDIEDDRLRNRVAQICLDFGLERIQFSAFFGRITRNLREQMALRILNEVEKQNARVRIMPVTEESLANMWEYDYWRRDADELARQAPESNAQASAEPALPRLRILRDLED
jgi:CRISPR-associated protein Cas2